MHNQSVPAGPSPFPASSPFTTATWRKASRSQAEGSDCVELANAAGVVGVRDSKAPHGPMLAVTPAVARAVAREIRAGQYDL